MVMRPWVGPVGAAKVQPDSMQDIYLGCRSCSYFDPRFVCSGFNVGGCAALGRSYGPSDSAAGFDPRYIL